MKTLSISELKLINALGIKKYRQKYNKFIVEGYKMIKELVTFYPERLELLIGDNSDLILEIIANQSALHDKCRVLDTKEFKKLSNQVNPQSIIAVANFNSPTDQIINPKEWNIYLDGLQDPGNVGTIIRTADWFGIKNIIFSKGCVDPYNTKVVQASMGSVFRMNFQFFDLNEVEDKIVNCNIWGADLNGENLYTTEMGAAGILCVGNEGEGLSDVIRKMCTFRIFIPGGSDKKGQSAESLNVSVATGIIISKIGQTLQKS